MQTIPFINEDDESESPFFDKYKIVEFLGQGAFAQVVSAINKTTNEPVAVKVLLYVFLVFIDHLEVRYDRRRNQANQERGGSFAEIQASEYC